MELPITGSTGNDLLYLALAKEVAEAAAQSTDLDGCLRILRAGLVRLGFSRAGIWLTDSENPALCLEPGELGGRAKRWMSTPFAYRWGDLSRRTRSRAGEKVIYSASTSLRIRVPIGTSRPHQALILQEGPLNNASLRSRVETGCSGLSRSTCCPARRPFLRTDLAMLELIGRYRGHGHRPSAPGRRPLQMTNQVLTVEIAERKRAEAQDRSAGAASSPAHREHLRRIRRHQSKTERFRTSVHPSNSVSGYSIGRWLAAHHHDRRIPRRPGQVRSGFRAHSIRAPVSPSRRAALSNQESGMANL